MGTGTSGRYRGTWGARRLAGEVVPASAEALRTAALLSAAAAQLGTTDDRLVEGIAQNAGVEPARLRAALLGGLPVVLGGEALELLGIALDGLLELLGVGALSALLLQLSSDARVPGDTQDAATERTDEADSTDEDRRPGIYENCKLAEQITGEAFHEDPLLGGHFGIRTGRRGKRKNPIYEIQHCGAFAQARAKALFEALSTGYTREYMIPYEVTEPFGVRRTLRDGTHITYRWKTGTKNSPAIEIRNPGSPLVEEHKIHFLTAGSQRSKEESR